MTENKAARTEGVLKALRTYRAEQGLSAPFPTLSAALFDMACSSIRCPRTAVRGCKPLTR